MLVSCGFGVNCKSGIGFPLNSRKQIRPVHLAHRFALLRRALSVAMPVFAYICLYSLEMKTNASRAFKDLTHFARFQISVNR